MLDPEYSTVPIGIPTLISHAHSDHTAALTGNCKSYVTQQTIDLFYSSQVKKKARNIKTVNFNEPFEIGGFEIEFIKAGHLLGAAQMLVRAGDETLHFTGDFCPEELLTVDAAELPRDGSVTSTILDCTYGDSKILFDDRVNTRQQLFLWVIKQLSSGHTPVINVAHLGSAQEIIKLFNKLMNHIPIVHPKITKVNEVYIKNEVSLDYEIMNKETISNIIPGKSIVLLPRAPSSIKEIQEYSEYHQLNISRAIVSGQSAKYSFNSFDFSAALSTHASFQELVDTIDKINPYHVFTYYGYPSQFSKSLNSEYDISSSDIRLCENQRIRDLRANGKKTKITEQKNKTLQTFFG